MKGRAFVAGALSGTAVLLVFRLSPADGVAEANEYVTPCSDSPRVSTVAEPSTRPAPPAIVAPQKMSIMKQTSIVKERYQALGRSSTPGPFVAPGLGGFGASDVYFNKKWIGIDIASHHSRESTSTTGGS